MSNITLYLVGGAVRDLVRGEESKINDWDFAVEADSYGSMREWINSQGFEIYLETPQYFTIRARSSDNFTFAGRNLSQRTFDFTLCRVEDKYLDGRHPSSVRQGTIYQDLSRRDFTVNAMALTNDGTLIDPYNGKADIQNKVIRCVGGTDRFVEDYLRVLRAIRFCVRLGYTLGEKEKVYLLNSQDRKLLASISEERVREELTKCFKADSLETLRKLWEFDLLTENIFDLFPDLWLMPTLKNK